MGETKGSWRTINIRVDWLTAVAFLAAACYLGVNGHPVACGWCIFGAIVSA